MAIQPTKLPVLSDQFTKRAEACEAQAATTTSEDQRKELLALATEWRGLSRRVARWKEKAGSPGYRPPDRKILTN